MTISRCTSTTGNCTKVSASNNFCFLPDGSSPENARGRCNLLQMQEKKITYTLMSLVFLIMEKECNEYKT